MRSLNTVHTSVTAERLSIVDGTTCAHATQFTHRSLPNASLLSAAQLALVQHCSHIDHRRTSLYCRRHNLRSHTTVHASITVERLPTVGGTTCARATLFTHRSPPNVSLMSAAQLALVQHCSHIDLRRMPLYCRRHNLRSHTTVHASITVERLPTVGGTTCAHTPISSESRRSMPASAPDKHSTTRSTPDR